MTTAYWILTGAAAIYYLVGVVWLQTTTATRRRAVLDRITGVLLPGFASATERLANWRALLTAALPVILVWALGPVVVGFRLTNVIAMPVVTAGCVLGLAGGFALSLIQRHQS